MKIGVDFDNTVICYDLIFKQVAVEKKLVPADLPDKKNVVRDYLRCRGQENAWIDLQGCVYGSRLVQASMFPGVKEFFLYCDAQGIEYYIVSHKTLHPHKGYPYNLHQVAYQWLIENQIECPVFFELTRADKIQRIARLECTHFIDDLPEFLLLPGFIETTAKILFDPHKAHTARREINIKTVHSWAALLDQIKQRTL